MKWTIYNELTLSILKSITSQEVIRMCNDMLLYYLIPINIYIYIVLKNKMMNNTQTYMYFIL